MLLVVLGFCAGLLGALTGIGGGVLLSPLLALYFGIPIRQAIGTSLVAVITTSAASSSVHLQRHTTDIRLGMTLELATAFGAAVTAYLVGYFNRNALEGLRGALDEFCMQMVRIVISHKSDQQLDLVALGQPSHPCFNGLS